VIRRLGWPRFLVLMAGGLATLLLAFFAARTVWPGRSIPHAAQPIYVSQRVVEAQQKASWVTVLDGRGDTVAGTLRLPGFGAGALAIDPRQRLWVCLEGIPLPLGGPEGNRVAVIDLRSGATHIVRVKLLPTAVAFSGDKAFVLCVVNGYDSAVEVVDLATLAVEREISLGRAYGEGLLMHNGRLLVWGTRQDQPAAVIKPDFVAAFDPASGQKLAEHDFTATTTDVGPDSQATQAPQVLVRSLLPVPGYGLALTNNVGLRKYRDPASPPPDGLYLLDETTLEVKGTIATPAYPYRLAFVPPDRLYVGHYFPGVRGPWEGLSVVDLSKRQVVKHFTVGGAPQDVAYLGGKVYVTLYWEGQVAVVDPATDTVTKVIPLSPFPNRLASGNQ
jgi:YVTN family beta-propeller protein